MRQGFTHDQGRRSCRVAMRPEDRSIAAQGLGHTILSTHFMGPLFGAQWPCLLGSLWGTVHNLFYRTVPKFRYILMPWGFDIRNPATLVGNALLCRTLIVLNAIRFAGKYQVVPIVRGSHEHPATTYSWHCKGVKLLFSHGRCGTVDVSYC